MNDVEQEIGIFDAQRNGFTAGGLLQVIALDGLPDCCLVCVTLIRSVRSYIVGCCCLHVDVSGDKCV